MAIDDLAPDYRTPHKLKRHKPRRPIYYAVEKHHNGAWRKWFAPYQTWIEANRKAHELMRTSVSGDLYRAGRA